MSKDRENVEYTPPRRSGVSPSSRNDKPRICRSRSALCSTRKEGSLFAKVLKTDVNTIGYMKLQRFPKRGRPRPNIIRLLLLISKVDVDVPPKDSIIVLAQAALFTRGLILAVLFTIARLCHTSLRMKNEERRVGKECSLRERRG